MTSATADPAHATRLRPLTVSDIPAWARLLAAVEAADRTGEHYDEADLAEEMANPDLDLDQDLVGAFRDDELVGYFCVYPRSADAEVHKVALEGAVHPALRGQGIGTLLARSMRERALTVHRERHPDRRGLLTLSGISSNTGQEQLLADIGMAPHRWSFTMKAVLGRELAGPSPVPDDLELKRYDASLDVAMHAAHNAAFVDHPSWTPWSETMWRHWVTDSRSFRPEMSFLLVDRAHPDLAVAYLQTAEFEAHQAQTGRREAYVGKVGTRREHRGRGLASLLLAHALREYRAAGYDEATLDVDSENPTGALGVYRRAGFEVESRWTDYALTVPAEPA